MGNIKLTVSALEEKDLNSSTMNSLLKTGERR